MRQVWLVLQYLLQVWLIVPNLLQVWQRYYDDPTCHIFSSAVLAALTWQHQGNQRVPGISHKNQSHPHDRWLHVSCVTRAQQAKALNKLGAEFLAETRSKVLYCANMETQT